MFRRSLAGEKRNSVTNNSKMQQLSAVEIASVLFCLDLKVNAKRDLSYVQVSRYTAKQIVSLLKSFYAKVTALDIHLVGSLAEGVNGPNSDLDFMFSVRNVFCCDTRSLRAAKGDRRIFLADCINASPGYVILWNATFDINESNNPWMSIKLDKNIKENSLVSFINITDGKVQAVARFGTLLLGSSELMEELSQPFMARSGPALTSTFGFERFFKVMKLCLRLDTDRYMDNFFGFVDKVIGQISSDQAYALPFYSDSILRNFIRRRRQFNWPPKCLLREIENIPAFVVPLGRKRSRFENKEWRISYTLAETHLIKSLNEVQLMLLYYLKSVTKEHIATICPAISSYVIKNLVLWMVECSPVDIFQYKNFIPLYKSSLLILRKRIWEGCLRNYLIPERNLLEGRISFIKRIQLYFKLRRLIKEGLNISKLTQIYKTIACKDIELLKEQLSKDKNIMIMRSSKNIELIKVMLSLVGFITPTVFLSGLMKRMQETYPKLPVDIPPD